MVDRTRRELTDDDIHRIADTYHAWRAESAPPSPAQRGKVPKADGGAAGPAPYKDIPGFCRSATLDEIRKHGHVLTPGRYVGAEAQDEDDEAFDAKMKRLTAQLGEQMARGAALDAVIREKLGALGYGQAL